MDIAIHKVIYPGIYGELEVLDQIRFGHQIHDYEKLSVKINKEMLIFFFRFYILKFNFKTLLCNLGGKIMVVAQSSNQGKMYSLLMMKSFLIWTFTLAVCLLVVGFPLVVVMATVGCLLSIVLQSVMPASAVLLVAGALVIFNVVTVLIVAGVLTAKSVHPKEVKWLSWLYGDAERVQTTVYASCPLTCEIK